MLKMSSTVICAVALAALLFAVCQPGTRGWFGDPRHSGRPFPENASERVLACIARPDESGEDTPFNRRFALAVAALQSDLRQMDWSELVCLALAEQAEVGQLQQARTVLSLAAGVERPDRQQLQGWLHVIERRLIMMTGTTIAADRQAQRERHCLQREQDYETCREALEQHRRLLVEQQTVIDELEIQVRKLKEVELILHPLPSE